MPTDATIGVHEAAMKTVSLCDASLRGALYANVVLVGGGTRLKGFPERFERELGMALERSTSSALEQVGECTSVGALEVSTTSGADTGTYKLLTN